MASSKRSRAWQDDVRHALRIVWRARAFTTAAVLTLAIGIAGTTVVFALIQGVLLRPLPVRDQDRLFVAWKEVATAESAQYPFGDVEIEAARRASRLLESAAGVTRNGVGRSAIRSERGSSYANVGLITGGFFEVLGVRPLLGRTLTTSDDREGEEHAAVISRGFWERQYGGAADVVGRRLRIADVPFTIVGVMPSDLDYPAGVEIWCTTRSVPTNGPFGDAARREVNLIGRLRPGVTIAQAASELSALSPRIDGAPAGAGPPLRPVVRAFADVVVGDVRGPILALFGAVALVLLIAVANVANLLLMRGESRRQEMAMRAALGAGRGRLARMVFAESLAISALAGIAGVAVAQTSLRTLIAFVPDGLPRAGVIHLDPSVVLFAVLIVAATTLLAGLAPALLTTRADLASTLRGGTASSAAVAAVRGRRLLVVAQVALAITVLTATGLLTRSVLQLQAVDVGMPVSDLALVELYVPEAKYIDRKRHERFLDDAMAALESVASIESATPVNGAPFRGHGWDVPRFTAEGQHADAAAGNPSLHLESIHPNYFETFRIAMRHGRPFTAADRAGALSVAILSDDVTERLWPGADPIGKRIKLGGLGSNGPWLTIVGVAASTRYRTVFGTRPTLYMPAMQFQMTATYLAVRSSADIALVASVARERLHALDADVQVMEVARFADMLAKPMARVRFNAWLLGIFGAAALLLSAIGLYAVMAAFVRQRDRELAIRMALGATASDMRRFVLTEAARLACLGALAGVAGAAAASRALQGMLFEVRPLDPIALASAAALLVGAAAIASYVPVRRATRADAASVLRSQ